MKMKQQFLFILFVFTVVWGSNSFAQRGTIKATIEPKEILIGQQAVINVEVKAAKGELILFPIFNDTIVSGLEVLSNDLPIDTLDTDIWTLNKKYTVTAFDSMRYRIAPIPVIVGIDTLRSDTLELFVTTPLLSENTLNYIDKYKKGEIDSLNFVELGIADIKPIVSPPFFISDYIEYIAYPLILILIVAIILLLLIFYKRKKKKGYYFTPVVVLPPDILAIKALNSLKEKNLVQKGLIKEYHTEITDVLRKYIQGRFGIDAPDMLTSEIISELSKKLDDSGSIMELREILELADLVKFARLQPLAHENDGSLSRSYSFVEKTKLLEEPKQPEGQEEALPETKEKVEKTKNKENNV